MNNLILLSFHILALILLYDSLSIGLTFYQKYFILDFHYPLTIVIGHIILKFIYACIIRKIMNLFTRKDPFHLDYTMYWKTLIPTGIASGLDIGLSNWSFEFITVSLYTMSKSSCIVFIFLFSICLRLQKLKLSNILTVVLIALGLFLFTYHSTQFNWKGFTLVMIAAMVGGIRWSLAQFVTQHKKFAVTNPLDVIFYVQPWMLTILLPLAIVFERELYWNMGSSLTPPVLTKIAIGSLLAFGMEASEYLLVLHTSGLTLGITGIFKEMVTLFLAAKYNGDHFSHTNFAGLVLCLVGISLHVVFRFLESDKPEASLVNSSKSSPYPPHHSHKGRSKKLSLQLLMADGKAASQSCRMLRKSLATNPTSGGGHSVDSAIASAGVDQSSPATDSMYRPLLQSTTGPKTTCDKTVPGDPGVPSSDDDSQDGDLYLEVSDIQRYKIIHS